MCSSYWGGDLSALNIARALNRVALCFRGCTCVRSKCLKLLGDISNGSDVTLNAQLIPPDLRSSEHLCSSAPPLFTNGRMYRGGSGLVSVVGSNQL